MTSTPSQSLDIGEAFRAGWRGFVANIGPLIVVALVVWVVTAVANWLATDTTGVFRFIMGWVSFFVGQLIAVVWISLGLAIVDGREITTDTCC